MNCILSKYAISLVSLGWHILIGDYKHPFIKFQGLITLQETYKPLKLLFMHYVMCLQMKFY